MNGLPLRGALVGTQRSGAPRGGSARVDARDALEACPPEPGGGDGGG